MTNTPKTFGRVLAELLVESGYVRKNNNPDWTRFVITVPGVSYETLRKAITNERPVSPKLMERVARALEVEPSVFLEYGLINARRELDPTQVGWPRAADALRAYEAGIALLSNRSPHPESADAD